MKYLVNCNTEGYTSFSELILTNLGNTVVVTPADTGVDWVLTLPPNDGEPDTYLRNDGNGSTSWVAVAGGGGGTVTSVGITPPSIFSASAPITTAGNINVTYSGVPLPVLNGGTGLVSVGPADTVLGSNGTSCEWVSGPGSVTITTTVPSFLQVTGPITGTGTIAITYDPAVPLPVANGGTGTGAIGAPNTFLSSNGTTLQYQDSTGTGPVVLQNNPTLTNVLISEVEAVGLPLNMFNPNPAAGTATLIKLGKGLPDGECFEHLFIYEGVNNPATRHIFRFAGKPGQITLTNDSTRGVLFDGSQQKRKVVLFERVNNNHEYDGFGTSVTTVDYQSNASTVDFVFRSGVNSTTSLEVFRIKGTGGFSTTAPASTGALSINSAEPSPLTIINPTGTPSTSTTVALGQALTPGNNLEHAFYYEGANSAVNRVLVRFQGLPAALSIFNTTTRGVIVHAGVLAKRKLVTWESANNDHQYDGIGSTNNSFDLQVNSAVVDFNFRSGTNSTTSLQLFKVRGTGGFETTYPSKTGDLTITNVTLASPSVTPYTLTLPPDAGTNQYALVSNGDGSTGWGNR